MSENPLRALSRAHQDSASVSSGSRSREHAVRAGDLEGLALTVDEWHRRETEALRARAEAAEKERDELRSQVVMLSESAFASSHRCVLCQGAVLPAEQTPLGYLCGHCCPGGTRERAEAAEKALSEACKLFALRCGCSGSRQAPCGLCEVTAAFIAKHGR